MAPKKAVSSARASKAGEKAIENLNVEEFRERFCIPNGIHIELEQFNAGSFARRCSRNSFTFLDSTHAHSSQYRPSAVDKGRGEGIGGGPGWMGRAIRSSIEALFPKLYYGISGGHLVDWVEKASFACVCKLYEINSKERSCKTLLTARNLVAVVKESQEYVVNILPRKIRREEVVPGEHYTVKELPLYQEAQEADAEKRRKLLEERDKKKNEGTIRKAPGQKGGPDPPPKETPVKRRKLVKKNGKDVREPTPPKEFPAPQITYEGSNDRGAERRSALPLKWPGRIRSEPSVLP
ncbi:hypothetical protein AAG906_013949 [Vitis piasezkii]